jgi:hypothetical protein
MHYFVVRDASDGATQPPMLSFKNFLHDQDDNIDQEEAVKRYNDYKTDFKKTQIAEFFAAHKDEDWFVQIFFFAFVSFKIRSYFILMLLHYSCSSEKSFVHLLYSIIYTNIYLFCAYKFFFSCVAVRFIG